MLSIGAWGFAAPACRPALLSRSGRSTAPAASWCRDRREFGTYVTATVVAGSSNDVTAELATRGVRGELDALSVLGVDPVTELVAPRCWRWC